MKAIIESIGKVGSRAHVGGHELVFDQPATVPGGEDRGPSPLDVMSVSVAACAHYFAAAYLHGRGLSTEGLTVEVEADEGARSRVAHRPARLKVQLPAGLDERHSRRYRAGDQELPGLRDAPASAVGRHLHRAPRRRSGRTRPSATIATRWSGKIAS